MKTFFKMRDESYVEFDSMSEKEKEEVCTQFNINSVKAYARARGMTIEDEA